VFYTLPSLDAKPRVLLDPNKLSTDGTMALSGIAVSHDAKFLAYGIFRSRLGLGWNGRCAMLAPAATTDDDVKWTKATGASWLPDSSGFFYSRFDEPAAGAKMTAGKLF